MSSDSAAASADEQLVPVHKLSIADPEEKVSSLEHQPIPHLQEGEQELINELRRRLSESGVEYSMTDMTVLRFIRGRKGDLDRAFRLITQHIQWRKDKNVDNISPEACPIEMSKKKACISGRDASGRPGLFAFARRFHLYIECNFNFHLFLLGTIKKIGISLSWRIT
jgi:hypothetical protein